MIGVIALEREPRPERPEALAELITGAIGSFRNAVEIDPSNADAKLEPRAGAADREGGEPRRGRDRRAAGTGASSAGIGQPGSGY